MPRRVTRRSFVQTSAAVGAAMFLPRSVWGANEKLNLACVGVTGRGGEDMDGVIRENVVAICDCDERNLAVAAKKAEVAKAKQQCAAILKSPKQSQVFVQALDAALFMHQKRAKTAKAAC